jgi:hypothetical protein
VLERQVLHYLPLNSLLLQMDLVRDMMIRYSIWLLQLVNYLDQACLVFAYMLFMRVSSASVSTIYCFSDVDVVMTCVSCACVDCDSLQLELTVVSMGCSLNPSVWLLIKDNTSIRQLLISDVLSTVSSSSRSLPVPS